MNIPGTARRWHACAALVMIAGVLFYAIYAMHPPRSLQADVPPDQFSAHRAIEHAFACSTEPHPAGSQNNDAVAAYFLNALRELGIEAEFMSKSEWVGGSLQLQQAVIGRIPGTDSTGAVAFSAHYDSVPYGPGATDDIAGCVVMLEAARAFLNRPRMRNDLVFLFLDAEEIGGYGARGFLDHPLAEEVGVITNLDVRGTKGPPLVFETSSGNGALIRELVRSRTHGVPPVANSFMFSVYERSPFGSDFTHFRRAGMKGYNIAYIDNFMWYHTMNDKPEHMHPPSVQHMGAYTMGLAAHYGDVDFGVMDLEAPNDVYFNTLGFHMVQYPMAWSTPLALAAAVFLLAMIGFGLYTRRLAMGRFLFALVLMPVGLVLAGLASMALLALVFGYDNMMHLYTVRFTYIPEPRALYYSTLYCYAFGALAIAVAGPLFSLAARRLRAAELYAAALAWLLPVLAALLVMFPGGSFMATWPLLFGTLGLAVLYLGGAENEPGPARLLAASVFGIPGLCLLAPGWLMLAWMLMILAAPALGALAVLILFNVMPALALIGRTRRVWMVYPVLAVIALVFAGAGLLLSRPGPDTPLMNSVTYYADLDNSEAWWLSEDMHVDAWTRQFFPEAERAAIDDLLPGHRGSHYLRGSAPVAAHLGGLGHEILEDTVDGDRRRLTLRLHTGDYPFSVRLRQVEGPAIIGATLDGTGVPLREGDFEIRFQLFPVRGHELSFELGPDDAVGFEAFTSSYGLPDVPGIAPRPAYMVPESNTMRDGISLRGQRTFIKSRFTLDPTESSTEPAREEPGPTSEGA